MCKVVRLFSTVFLLTGMFLTLQCSTATAGTVDPQVTAVLPAELTPRLSADGSTLINGLPLRAVVDDPNPGALRHIPAPAALLAEPDAASATFTITYVPGGETDPWGENCTTFPANAKAAFTAAANIWANTLSSSVPVTISACWADLGSTSVLGYSGGGPLHRDFTGATRTNTWYTGSLANALNGSDLSSAEFDMHITYNSTFSWYYGTDGNTPSDQHDLMSVVLHEIAHGLNFSGSMVYESGSGSWGNSTGYPNIYDIFMRDGSGKQLITYTNGSTALGDALTSNDLWFYGSKAMAANGNQRVKMYAPASWSSGSSFSHLDYDTFNNTANQLMVYAISAGESIHDPGVITRGLLSDLGWPTSSTPASSLFSWNLFLPAITSKPSPVWGAYSYACCTTKPTTFYLTQGATVRKSYNPTCADNDNTFEGWVETSAGTKTFSWSYYSCSTIYRGSFSYPLERGKAYLFYVRWEDGPVLYVRTYRMTASAQSLTATGMIGDVFSEENLLNVDSMQLEVESVENGVSDGADNQCESTDFDPFAQ